MSKQHQYSHVVGYKLPDNTFSYSERDVSLYALGVGAAADPMDEKELKFVYELGDGFTTLPTYGVVIPFSTLMGFAEEEIDGFEFNPMSLLHGEQYTEIRKPIPTKGTFVTSAKISQILDKGSGAVLLIDAESKDESGEVVLFNRFTLFIRGMGGFGGERGPSSKINEAPDREPDAIVEQKTVENQALLYRLSGDYNPLHIDPEMAGMGGFDKPILHGLCTFGFAGRAILEKFCDNDTSRIKSFKVRFAKHIFPGETIITRMWKVSADKILFECRCKERDVVILSNALAEIVPGEGEESSSSSSSSNSKSYPSDEVFALISDGVKANGKKWTGKVRGIIQWNLTDDNDKNTVLRSWIIDLKNGNGSVQQGVHVKPTCTMTASESDFMLMATGKLNSTKAYLKKRLKFTGLISAAQKFEMILNKERKAKL